MTTSTTVPAEAEDDVRNTLHLSCVGLANRAITVLTQVVLASQLGRTVFADIYFAVEIFPDLFIVLLGSGLSLAAIPVYARLRLATNDASSTTSDEDDHWRFASSFILTIASLFAIVTGILMLAAPMLVSLLAPGFEGETRSQTISLLRIVLASLAFLGPEAGLRALFHSHRHFVTPDLTRFVYNMVLLGAVIFLEPRIGIDAVGWGMVTGSVVMITIQFISAYRFGLIGRRWHRFHPAVARLVRKTPLILVILAWPMVLLLLDRASASALDEGTVAALGYAARIVMLPIGIIALPIASAIYPRISELGGRAPLSAEFGRELTNGLRLLLFLVLPACGVLFAARGLVVETLFERGQFDSEATRSTARLVQIYLLSVPGLAVTFFLRNVYLALDRAFSLCAISLVAWGLAILVNISTAGAWGASGIALMTAVVSTGTAAFLVIDLATRCQLHIERRELGGPLAAMVLLALGLAGTVDRGYATVSNAVGSTDLVARLAILSFVCAGGVVGYLSLARAFAIREAIWLVERLRRAAPGMSPT